jgi:hypothetical protein
MNDREFQDFLQKQRDYEDELKQQMRSFWEPFLKIAEQNAANMNMDLDQYIAWVETNPSPQSKRVAATIREAKEYSK